MRSPHVQRFDRVADGHVTIHTHHRQSEGAGEHIVVVDRHHCLAQSVPEWPEAQKHICALDTSQGKNIGEQAEQRPSSLLIYDC